jgi:CubicO group peptidase (beta-lactamase class C family)
MYDNLIKQLDAEMPGVEELRQASGAAALSLGVFHHGQIIYTKHFGHRDIITGEAPDDDSVHYFASSGKCIGICAIARLVSDGVLDWDEPIRSYLPEFHRPNDDFGNLVTLRDLACHRTGLPLANFWWAQMGGENLLSIEQLIRQTCDLDTIKPFRSTFHYSSWNYILMHAVVEKVTGKAFGQIVAELILNPLGLEHTTFESPVDTPNLVHQYAVRNDRTLSEIPMNPLDSTTGLSSNLGGKGTMTDILRFFSGLLSAYAFQNANGLESTSDSPFRQLSTILEPHIPLNVGSPSSYCLGMYRTRLPATLSCASLNAPLLGNKVPLFGLKHPGTEVFHHAGNIPGAFSSYFLLPETQSGVVCLTNSTPLFDPSDFAAQIALSVLLGEPKIESLIVLGKLATKAQMAWYQNINQYLSTKRTTVPPHYPLSFYAGTYINRARDFILIVTSTATGLHIAVQGSKKTTYDVQPLDGDSFYFPADRDLEVSRGGFPYPFPPLHVLKFWVRELSGEIRLIWHTDMALKPDVFRKVKDGDDMPMIGSGKL